LSQTNGTKMYTI
jgi:hypothetical protein